MRKRERQQLVETLIRQKQLSTQGELVAALREFGCPVTQATISATCVSWECRRGQDVTAGPVMYCRRLGVRRDPAEILARVLGESGATVQAAQNLVVVRSEPGTAPAVGLAIDELEREEIVGTVAGDDTVLLVLPDVAAAQGMVELLTRVCKYRS